MNVAQDKYLFVELIFISFEEAIEKWQNSKEAYANI